MTLRTAICDLLAVDHPIGNAGMAGVAHPRLCAAVAEAGGIGTVAMGGASATEVTERVAAVKALTPRPFSANFISWIIEKDSSPLDAALEAGVASLTLSFGDPAPFVDRVHSAGSLLLSQVQTVEAARRSAEVGADVIICRATRPAATLECCLFFRFSLRSLMSSATSRCLLLAESETAAGSQRCSCSARRERSWVRGSSSRTKQKVTGPDYPTRYWPRRPTTRSGRQRLISPAGAGGRTGLKESAPAQSAHRGSIVGLVTKMSSRAVLSTTATLIMVRATTPVPPTPGRSPAC